MESKWTMREYTRGDEEGILQLWKETWPQVEVNQESWLKRWYWMYRDNPYGFGKIWLAEYKNKIVGHYALIPRLIKVGSQVIGGALSLQTMTHPDYRRLKIFEKLANRAYDEACKNNILVILGFPNQYSYPGLINRLRWFEVAGMNGVAKVINWEKFLKTKTDHRLLIYLGKFSGTFVDKVFYRQRKKPAEKNLNIIRIHSFDKRINEFWQIVSKKHKIITVRSKEYLNWRYVSNPTVDYQIYLAEKTGQICGYLVLRSSKLMALKKFTIVDLLSSSVSVSRHLISKALDHCYDENADIITCTLIANKLYFKAFRMNGFITLPYIKHNRFCVYSRLSDQDSRFLKIKENWHVIPGDSDTS